jgi:hypothetical protein
MCKVMFKADVISAPQPECRRGHANVHRFHRWKCVRRENLASFHQPGKTRHDHVSERELQRAQEVKLEVLLTCFSLLSARATSMGKGLTPEHAMSLSTRAMKPPDPSFDHFRDGTSPSTDCMPAKLRYQRRSESCSVQSYGSDSALFNVVRCGLLVDFLVCAWPRLAALALPSFYLDSGSTYRIN